MEDDDDDDAGAGAGFGACGRVLEWEHGLPTEEELTPLSHPLVPPALAAAFRIDVRGTAFTSPAFDCAVFTHNSPTSHLSFRCEDEDEDDEGEGEGEGEDESEDATSGSGGSCRGGSGRAGKKARMVWTPELHHRFVEAVAHLGDKGAVPKAIVRLMNVEGLTRENVASHLQKYRIYLKRTRGPAKPQQPPPAFPPAYGSHFRPQQLSDTSNGSDYSAFSTSPAATARSSNATKQLWDRNGPDKRKTF